MIYRFSALVASFLVRTILGAAVSFTIFLPSVSTQVDSKPASPSIDVQYDVPYGSDPLQTLDLCQPNNQGQRRPAVLLIHGGGGDKSEFTRICTDLADNGFVAAAVNYRESPSPTYQVILADNQLALRWVQSLRSVDSTKMGAWGGSMGGYVASMEGTDGSRFSNKVSCVSNNYGPTNFTNPLLWPNTSTIVDLQNNFFGGVTYSQDPALYDDLSPISHVSTSSAQSWLFTRSTNDQLVPENQMLTMVAALKKVGIQTQTFEYAGTGGGHANNLPSNEANHLYQLRLNFMVNCLNGLQ